VGCGLIQFLLVNDRNHRRYRKETLYGTTEETLHRSGTRFRLPVATEHQR